MARLSQKHLIYLWLPLSLIACNPSEYSPKPRAYHRLYLPQKQYGEYDNGSCPFQFVYPTYATIQQDSSHLSKPCWINILFKGFNASLHLSYYPLKNSAQLDELTEDAHTFAFKHTVKASYIDETLINYPEKNVYGIFYTIGGNTASSAQFFVTDSTKHYLRAALYFNEKPKIDSLQPALDYLVDDMNIMIQSLEWN
ncbi:gliding motility protein GldD [Olivibacter sitiensis]|uniref:gliding motility lipoprotein GldD n=1 Tax=Olivibacter sitiensis TaxID=376470 RepID=UPI0003FF689A|nr:gliding motility protein GldD [Olivibacter sitiensis]